MLLDVGFNREVAVDGALYWTKDKSNLSNLINEVDYIQKEKILELSTIAKNRIAECYSWDYIVDRYEDTFLQ